MKSLVKVSSSLLKNPPNQKQIINKKEAETGFELKKCNYSNTFPR